MAALALVGGALAFGCAATSSHQGVAETPEHAREPAGDAIEASHGHPMDSSAPLAAGSSVDAPKEGPAESIMPDTPPDPSRSLPEVTVRNVGLHIGGEPNDAASKAPFQEAIAAKFEDFLQCYRHAVEPEKGGVFGVDLFIRRAGGGPEVRQPRTGMKGTEFRQCMITAFESVNFQRPQKGPTIISYSIKFEVRDSATAAN